MNRTQHYLLYAVVLLLAMAAIPREAVVSADTTNEFGGGSASKTLTFEGKESNHEATLKLSAEAEVEKAYLKLEGEQNGGSYPYHPSFLIEDDGQWETIWNFNGSAYGSLGEQNVFSDNGTSAPISFGGEEEKTRSLYIPKNATITSATMDISGTKDFGTRTTRDTASEDSLITSHTSSAPAVVSEGSNVYMAWIDSGDLNYAGYDYDIFFKISNDNGTTWHDSVLLSETAISANAPTIAVDGDRVGVAWSEGNDVYFRMSEDGGESWNDVVNVEGFVHRNPVVSCSDGYIYLTWMTRDNNTATYQVGFTRSTDGENWETLRIISNIVGSGIHSQYPWISSYGDCVYVAWYEHDRQQSTYDLLYKHSANNGATFQTSPTEIKSGSDTMDEVRVASNENGHVYAVWLRFNNTVEVFDVDYAYSMDHGSTWSTPANIDDTDANINDVTLSSEMESGVDYVYVAWKDHTRNISFRLSTNETAWEATQWITDQANYPTIHANDNGHVYIGYARTNQTNIIGNQDIFINISDGRGATWDENETISTRFFDGRSGHTEMVVVGDEIFMVWVERGNISGIENGIDSDILFRHFDGDDWGDLQAISVFAEDGTSLNPHISVDGEHIYVVWQDYVDGGDEGEDTDMDVYVRYSSNGGTSWDPALLVSDDVEDGESWYPRVGSSGSTEYVVWRDDGNIDDSWMNNDICFRRISAGVLQGNTYIITDHEEDRDSFRPDIAVDGSNIHVVWYEIADYDSDGIPDYDIIYRKSTNGGTSWDPLVVVSQTTTHAYYPVVSLGDYIYVVWEESEAACFSRSESGGNGTWSEQQTITSQIPYNFNIDSIVDRVVLVYRANMELHLTSSYDAGDTWEDPVIVSTDDSFIPDYPTVIIIDYAIHIAYHDSGNITGNGWDSDIVHHQIADYYSSNVELDVGNDGDVDWQHNGELNGSNSPQTYSGNTFVNELQQALETAPSFKDSYENEIATIEFRVTSDTAGLVALDNLRIEYDYSVRSRDFTSALNNYIADHQDDQDGEGNIEIPFVVTSESAGKITIFDLDVEYKLRKLIIITSPEGNGTYRTTIDITWLAENFEDEDLVVISYYNGSNWNVLDTVPANDESWNNWDTSGENGKYYKVRTEYVDDTEIRDETNLFMIDNHPPTTTHILDYTEEYNDGVTVWGTEVDISLIRDDDFEGGDNGSGVRISYYQVDEGAWIEYTGLFTIDTPGNHTFNYYSIDEMDNTEGERTGEVSILDIPFPELSVEGIIFDQNGPLDNLVDRVPVVINISVHNSGTLDVEGVELKVYEDDKQPGSIIATESVDLEAGQTRIVSVSWTPQMTADTQEITIIAIIEELENEGNFDNNEMSTPLTVMKMITVSGSGEEDGMPLFIPVLIAITLITGIGGAVLFIKKSRENKDGSDSFMDGLGWENTPAATAAPKPAPEPESKAEEAEKPASEEAIADTKPTVDDATDTAADTVTPVKFKCPKCMVVLSIKTLHRPITVKCPKCETKLIIKG